MTKPNKKDDFDESNEVQSNWVKFNVPQEDKVFGTLIAKRQIKSTLPGKENELTWAYDMKTEYGSFHELDDTKKVIEVPVSVNDGEIWTIGGKPIIDRQMTNIKIGQKIGVKFIEVTPSKTKGYNPAKIIKIYTPKNEDGTVKMDTEWLEEQSKEKESEDFGL